ncbi:MAG: hypothetical protein R3E08_08585 [Thiotrichaceae bacterium]
MLDRNENPLTITYQNDWNLHDFRPLHRIPEILQKTFILSEDKRFYELIWVRLAGNDFMRIL